MLRQPVAGTAQDSSRPDGECPSVNIRNIAEFLDTMQEGELESSGVFTLDWSKALEKLGRYQSEAAGFWVVKFLQAAVAMKAPQFIVQQTRQSTTLSFAPSIDPAALVEALQRLEPPSDPALAHLQMGVQAVSFVEDASYELRLTLNGEVRPFPIREARLVGQLPQKVRTFSRLDFVRHWSKPAGLFQRGPAQRYTDENLFLQEVGRFAPIAIRVDNRLLNDPLANKPPGLRLGVPVPSLGKRPWPAIPHTLLERIVLCGAPVQQRMALLNHGVRRPKRLRIGPDSGRGQGSAAYHQEWVSEDHEVTAHNLNQLLEQARAIYTTFDSKIERADGVTELWHDYNLKLPAVTVRGYLSMDLCPGNEGRLYVVKDGVAMKPRSLGPRFKGCLALWSEPRIRTDLSQLQVVDDSVYAETVAKITEHYTSSARNVLSSEETNPGFFRRLIQAESTRLVAWAKKFLSHQPP